MYHPCSLTSDPSDSSDPLRSTPIALMALIPLTALTSNLYLHLFTRKFVRCPPFSNIHVESLKSPRGYFLFSTWGRFDSSEVSFDSSEVSFHSSEEFFIPHVEISKYPRGNQFSSTQRCIDM